MHKLDSNSDWHFARSCQCCEPVVSSHLWPGGQCVNRTIYFSVENPGQSFMWDTTPFQKLCGKHQFLEVFFHHCQYGSGRRKLTKLLHHVPSFQELEKFCSNDHAHEPWGPNPAGHWNTSEEATYPWPLCRAIAAKLVTQLHHDCQVSDDVSCCQNPL